MNLRGRILFIGLMVALTVGQATDLRAQTPEWIWHHNNGAAVQPKEIRYFRKTFQADAAVNKAVLTAAGDNQAIVFLNGSRAGISRDWDKPVVVDVTREVRQGSNLLAVRGQNQEGEAAVIVKLELTLASGETQWVVTDTSWLSSAIEVGNWFTPRANADDWSHAVSKGKLGVDPWGDIMAPRAATPAEKLAVLSGFKVELVRSAEIGEGSWVSLAVDRKGRLIFSPQEGVGNMLRASLTSDGQIEKLERISLPVGSAMGLLYAFDSLYMSGAGPRGLGLYRLRDLNNDDQFDEARLLKKFDGAAGEHGSHAVVLGPDDLIYSIHGNFVKVPSDISPGSPHKNYAEDQLLPRGEDGNGFGAGIKPPGGFVARTDAEGKRWEIVAAGMRNAYDFDFNADGELFTYDSDMEWDWGTPWYRPTRVYHLVSAGDYGFREGTGKFPVYYPDMLPPALDAGIGSPTGVKFGTKSKFPPKYQKALYAMDWSYGRIFAVHFTPRGATYTGAAEEFVRGKPLNVTDLEFGQDGAMYFLTGGRGTQSGLYRVSYTGGSDAWNTGTDPDETAGAARRVRQGLETFHGKRDPKAIDFAWPRLESSDRWIRYAARVAIESQDPALWTARALQETQINTSLAALLALARVGHPKHQADLLAALDRLPASRLTEEQKLEALRVLSLALIRLGKPDPNNAAEVIARLDSHYPSQRDALNRELSQLLIFLEAPGVVEKTLALIDGTAIQEHQIHYVFHLRTLKSGWTPESRRRYFGWFNRNRQGLGHPPELLQWFRDAGREYADGASFPKFIANIRKDAEARLNSAERADLETLLAGRSYALPAPAVQRDFVKDWGINDLSGSLADVSHGRSYPKGKEAFLAAQCLSCHQFGSEGGAVGPDLTAISSRFTRRDILDSILDPSKVVSEQYQNTTIFKRAGEDVTGRILEENGRRIVLTTNPLTQDRTEIRKSEILRREPSKVSPMPQGLVNVLTKDEILDLLAYLESGGKPDAAHFKRGE